MECSQVLVGSYPFDPSSDRGLVAARTKRALIGIIVAVGFAVAVFFSQMALCNVWNPFNMSPGLIQGFAIGGSVCGGVLLLVASAIMVIRAEKKIEKEEEDF